MQNHLVVRHGDVRDAQAQRRVLTPESKPWRIGGIDSCAASSSGSSTQLVARSALDDSVRRSTMSVVAESAARAYAPWDRRCRAYSRSEDSSSGGGATSTSPAVDVSTPGSTRTVLKPRPMIGPSRQRCPEGEVRITVSTEALSVASKMPLAGSVSMLVPLRAY